MVIVDMYCWRETHWPVSRRIGSSGYRITGSSGNQRQTQNLFSREFTQMHANERQKTSAKTRPARARACSNLKSYLEEITSEWVMAWTERAMRFCTPTLRISFAT